MPVNLWSLHHEASKAGRTYTRPLGTTELGYYWNSLFNGTTDIVQHAAIEVTSKSLGELSLFERTWIQLKLRYPLLGASLEEQGDRRQINFVVNDLELGRLNSGEVELRHVSSDKEVQEFMDQLVNGKRRLSNQLLARLFIIVQDVHRYHIFVNACHCIIDGISIRLLIRTILEELSSPKDHEVWKLEERLALATASEDLLPIVKRSRPAQRWHRAMGHVIWSLRMRHLIGGHMLPRTYTTATKFTPATSGVIEHSFTEAESSIIMKNCKKLELTLNNVLPVLEQVALTRLLCRRYIRGDIDAEEWEFRKREPMMSSGPLNLRPSLDRQWHDGGGASNVCVAVSFFFYRLPFMPLGVAHFIAPGDKLPTYGDLLSPGRFVLRSQFLRKQAAQLMKHPLFHEIASARLPMREQLAKETALAWINAPTNCHGALPIPIPVWEQSAGRDVLSLSSSNTGKIDNMVPRMYGGSQAEIKVRRLSTALHCKPAELYLTSSSFSNELKMRIYWDKNVYDEPTIAEWLVDLVEATKHYLGEDTV